MMIVFETNHDHYIEDWRLIILVYWRVNTTIPVCCETINFRKMSEGVVVTVVMEERERKEKRRERVRVRKRDEEREMMALC